MKLKENKNVKKKLLDIEGCFIYEEKVFKDDNTLLSHKHYDFGAVLGYYEYKGMKNFYWNGQSL